MRWGCLGLCSHRRAVFYYYHSIREPGLFPSVACPSVEECNQEHASNDQVRPGGRYPFSEEGVWLYSRRQYSKSLLWDLVFRGEIPLWGWGFERDWDLDLGLTIWFFRLLLTLVNNPTPTGMALKAVCTIMTWDKLFVITMSNIYIIV